MAERQYRCLTCLEHTIARGFDVSHLSRTCEGCGEFSRFINDQVYDQFLAFEDDPPAHLDWERLARAEKLMLSERVTRTTRSVEDFEIED